MVWVAMFVLAVAAETTVTFNAADPQASYANGAVAMSYDGAGNIVDMSLDPATAGGIVLMGDALSFAANAKLRGVSAGTVGISNAVTSVAAGTLALSNLTDVVFGGTITLAEGSTLAVDTVGAPEGQSLFRANDVTNSWITLWKNASLMVLTNVVGSLGGSVLGAGNKVPVKTYFFKNDGVNASCQLQYRSSDTMYRSLVLQFRQSGNDVQMQTYRRTYRQTASPAIVEAEGTVDFTIDSNCVNASGGSTVSAYAPSGLFATNLTFLASCDWTTGRATFYGENASSQLALVVGGGATRSEIYVRGANGMPTNGTVEVRARGMLHLAVPGLTVPETGVDRQTPVTVRAGGLFKTTSNYQLAAKASHVALDGGRFDCRAEVTTDDSDTYVAQIDFADGAVLSGAAPRIRTANGLWTVSGTTPSRCETGVIMWSHTIGTYGKLTLDVADVTGDADVDFSIAKSIRLTDTPAGDGWRWASLVKKGAGTVRIDGMLVMTNLPTRVEAGTLLVNGNLLHAADDFTLAGGTLAFAAGTTNACRVLNVEPAGGTLALADNAELCFADSSAATWSGAGAVILDYDPAKSRVRFGMSQQGLSAVQRVRLQSAAGNPLSLDAAGYVCTAPGTIVVVR